MLKGLSFVCILFQLSMVFGQLSIQERKQIDSLKYIIASTQNDTTKINAYVAWDELIYISDPELDKELNENIISICEHHLSKKSAGKNKKFYQEQLAASYNIIGIFYEDRGVFPLALDYHTKSLDLQKELNNTMGIAHSYNNLGILYLDRGDYEMAEDYFEKCIQLRLQLKDYAGLGNTYNNVGLIYQKKHDYPASYENFIEGKRYFKKAEDDLGVALIDFNVGVGFGRQFQYDSAMYYFEKAYETNLKYGALDKLAPNLHQMAFVENYKGDSASRAGNFTEAKLHYSKARDWSEQGVQMGEEINSFIDIMDGNLTLIDALKGLKDYEGAAEALWDYTNAKDSLHKANDDQQFYNMQYEFEYNNKVEADSIKQAEAQKVADARLEKEKTQRYALYGGIGLLVLFGAFIYNRFRNSQKQKAVIEEQKAIVEEKNEEILDSINYAKRIQAAILPPTSIVDKYLPQNFVYYLPKDIVAGDFYWLQHTENGVLFAAADCTGHGVPGAMVSVVCNNALNRSVKEFGLSEPGLILDKTREIVIDEFSRAEENVKDGMDIALCNLSGMTLSYAGANNPLWLIRNGELTEYKADRQPVGNFDHQKAFQTVTIQLEPGDQFYIFSDGIVDQFGGPKGKKFKPKALKELLLNNSMLNLEEQRHGIHKAFESWKGGHEQLDDICMIAVKV